MRARPPTRACWGWVSLRPPLVPAPPHRLRRLRRLRRVVPHSLRPRRAPDFGRRAAFSVAVVCVFILARRAFCLCGLVPPFVRLASRWPCLPSLGPRLLRSALPLLHCGVVRPGRWRHALVHAQPPPRLPLPLFLSSSPMERAHPVSPPASPSPPRVPGRFSYLTPGVLPTFRSSGPRAPPAPPPPLRPRRPPPNGWAPAAAIIRARAPPSRRAVRRGVTAVPRVRLARAARAARVLPRTPMPAPTGGTPPAPHLSCGGRPRVGWARWHARLPAARPATRGPRRPSPAPPSAPHAVYAAGMVG